MSATGTTTPGTNAPFGALKQVDAGQLSVGHAEDGPPDGRAVILLHGWPYDIHTVRELNTGIRHWIDTWNDNPRPYLWTKTADQILESIARYCTRINDSGHQLPISRPVIRVRRHCQMIRGHPRPGYMLALSPPTARFANRCPPGHGHGLKGR